jgi:hypothetical protein
VETNLRRHASLRSVRFEPLRHHLLGLVVAVCLASSGRSNKPDAVDVRPITSLQLTAGPDFLNRIQKQLGGRAADWSKNGVGYLVYRLPNPDPNVKITAMSMCIVKTAYRRLGRSTLTIGKCLQRPGSGQNWKLYREQGTASEKWFTSYQGAHFDTNHGMPVWWDTNPDIYVGVLKQNVFIEVSYTAYTSSSNYIQTINKDIRLAADLLSKAAFSYARRINRIRWRIFANARRTSSCSGFYSAGRGQGLPPLSRTPFSASGILPALRSGQLSLDEAEQIPAQSGSQLRYAPMVFGIIPECRTVSLRN